MTKQRRLFFDLPAEPTPEKAVVFPERTKRGFSEVLKPITRKNSFQALAQLKGRQPVLICVQRINEAKKLSGLNNQQIAKLVGLKSRDTVGKILRLEEGIGFHDFCAVMNVLGLELAELFPMRKRKAEQRTKFPRGYVDVEVARKPDVLAGVVKTKRFGDYMRRKKRWG